MRDVASRLAREYPDSNRQIGAVVVPIKEDLLGDTSLQLAVLLAAAGCVLLVACANIASLLLSRALSRRTEMAVRAAIGATGARLVRQMTIEAMILALAGGVLGVTLAPAGMRVLEAMVPLTVAAPQASTLDPRLLGFAVLLSVATGVLFSIVPAVHTSRATLNAGLQHAGRAGIGGRSFARDALVVAQISAALVLLVGAGLLIRTLANLRGIDVGFRADHLLTLSTTLPAPKYADRLDRLAFYERVVARTRALPGVESAAYVSTLPFQSIGNTNGYVVEGRVPAPEQDALYRVGTADYLKTIGATLVEGRVSAVRSMEEIVDLNVVDRTGQTLLLGAFAGLALLLACLGLYGVLSYAVTQRTPEIGVRLALGATMWSIARLVIGRGLTLTGLGLAIGIALAWAATRTIRSLLIRVGAYDVTTFGGVVGLLIVVALGACTLPAMRAVRIDPMRVLRQD